MKWAILMTAGLIASVASPCGITASDKPAPATISGRVFGISGEILANVRVRVSAVNDRAESKEFLARTNSDKNGRFTIKVPVEETGTQLIIDFFKPDYLVGTTTIDYSGPQFYPRNPRLSIRATPAQTVKVLYLLTREGEQQDEVARPKRGAAGQAVMISGFAIDEQGEPLQGVQIRAVDTGQIRQAGAPPGMKVHQVQTDANGQYQLQIPVAGGMAAVSIDALKPHFHSLPIPTEQRLWNNAKIVYAGSSMQIAFIMKKALYIKGKVVDDAGLPVANAHVSADNGIGGSSSRLQQIHTAKDGEFEIFTFDLEPPARDKVLAKGQIHVYHQEFLSAEIPDVYALSPEQQSNLRIQLSRGLKISGQVRDKDGAPVADAMIEAIYGDIAKQRTAFSDATGQFVVPRLTAGKATLRAESIRLHQKIKIPISVGSEDQILNVQLQPFPPRPDFKVVSVLGMKLADITPEVADYYDLDRAIGALILDPGPNAARLGIADAIEGEYFSAGANGQMFMGIRGFVKTFVNPREPRRTDGVYYNIRIVGRNPKRTEMPARLTLTDADLAELQELLGKLPKRISHQPLLGTGLNGTDSCKVVQVVIDSPADEAGLKTGDEILKFDGKSISDPKSLIDLVKKSRLGVKIPIEIRRDGKIVNLDVTL